MTTKDQAWAERVGREAVALGFPCVTRLRSRVGCVGGFVDIHEAKHGWAKTETWPDFRDRLTELACISWVEDVAREVYGELYCRLSIDLGAEVCVEVCTFERQGGPILCFGEGDALAEACIAAVRAMKGVDQ